MDVLIYYADSMSAWLVLGQKIPCGRLSPLRSSSNIDNVDSKYTKQASIHFVFAHKARRRPISRDACCIPGDEPMGVCGGDFMNEGSESHNGPQRLGFKLRTHARLLVSIEETASALLPPV